MTIPEKFSGVLAPVITPFKKGRFLSNPKRLIEQCKWLVTQNVRLAVFGTNSEANSLSTDEKIYLLDEIIKGGINPRDLMPGTGCCALSDSVKLTKHAVSLGVQGTLMLPPFYYKDISNEGLYASYSEIIEQVGSDRLRVYLYHIPPISGIALNLPLIERLIKKYPNTVVGIKDSSGDWSNTLEMLNAGWDDFRIFVGSEAFLLRNLRNGGAGCISATANINPAQIVDLFSNWQVDGAEKIQADLDRIRDTLQPYPMIPALKAITGHYRKDDNWYSVRPPLTALKQVEREKLIKSLEAVGFQLKYT